ncbi:MAG: hypothetical protein R2784_15015 [Saprospiraceae bacterium]
MKKWIFGLGLFFLSLTQTQAAYILIPMDAESQSNHLKAYGITYWVLDKGVEAWWFLNYRGGSFCFQQSPVFERM